MWYWGVFIIVAVVSMLVVAIELYPVARRDRAARPWAILAARSAFAMPAAIMVHNVASALIAARKRSPSSPRSWWLPPGSSSVRSERGRDAPL